MRRRVQPGRHDTETFSKRATPDAVLRRPDAPRFRIDDFAYACITLCRWRRQAQPRARKMQRRRLCRRRR